MPLASPLIEIHALTKRYGEFTAVDALELSVLAMTGMTEDMAPCVDTMAAAAGAVGAG